MPKKNGVEFTQMVRANDMYKGTPILILSTENSPEKKKDAERKGITGWVKKPYALDDFLKIIKRVIK